MSSGASERMQNRRWLKNDAAAKLFREGMSYRKIAAQLGITTRQAEAAVKAALGDSPQKVRQDPHHG